MLLKTVFIRFYKSFNFDYIGRLARTQFKEWDRIGERKYPFVEVPIENDITAIVGANESGKSHLLSAVKVGLLNLKTQLEDVCRYSDFFNAKVGQSKLPDFGYEFSQLTDSEKLRLQQILGLESDTRIDKFYFFKFLPEDHKIYLNDDQSIYNIDEAQLKTLYTILPTVFEINSKIALPDSVPLSYLIDEHNAQTPSWKRLGASGRNDLGNLIVENAPQFATPEAIANNNQHIFNSISARLNTLTLEEGDVEKTKEKLTQYQLAEALLYKIGDIDKKYLTALYKALTERKQGLVQGILNEINLRLEVSLNFPKFWVQDRNFQLRVTVRDYELVFTIRDRTNTEYTFAERSHGLKYFLSYYIQYLAHTPSHAGDEILLMDEPDAYLSSQAQQDLLKIFEGFAHPATLGNKSVQVIYVTHSPFLIDKNNSQRIRVLEKGAQDEGTRVVYDCSRNHYEPLRSAVGIMAGEMVFIGNCNLLVEGASDQIYLSGAAQQLTKDRIKTPIAERINSQYNLDLNIITIVPCGGAENIPYMVYLSRGRDVEQPAIIALLDNDDEGLKARRRLARAILKDKGRLLQANYLIGIEDIEPDLSLGHKLTCIESLIPLSLAICAAHLYFRELFPDQSSQLSELNANDLHLLATESGSVLEAINLWIAQRGLDIELSKIGFARSVIDLIKTEEKKDEIFNILGLDEGTKQFKENMQKLNFRINEARRKAEEERNKDRVSGKVNRLIDTFVDHHQSEVTKEDLELLIERIRFSLDESLESSHIDFVLQQIESTLKLGDKTLPLIDDTIQLYRLLDIVKSAGKLGSQDRGILQGGALNEITKLITAQPAI